MLCGVLCDVNGDDDNNGDRNGEARARGCLREGGEEGEGMGRERKERGVRETVCDTYESDLHIHVDTHATIHTLRDSEIDSNKTISEIERENE